MRGAHASGYIHEKLAILKTICIHLSNFCFRTKSSHSITALGAIESTFTQHMQPVEAATHRKQQIALVLAFAATCIFGRMSFGAATSAFEHPAPTTFEQLAWLWNLLRWSIPALLIGTLFTRRVMGVAAVVSLTSGFVLLALEFSSFVPKGSYLPESMYLWRMAAELATCVAIASCAAMTVRTAYRWTASRLTQQKPASHE
jgi:hypothetical protein